MSKKVKSLGKANDNIPADELLLAKLVQNAKAHGMKATKGAYYRTARGKPLWCDVHEAIDLGAKQCCAVGATWLAPDTKRADETFGSLVTGNDNGQGALPIDPIPADDKSLPGWSAGAAFQDAMK